MIGRRGFITGLISLVAAPAIVRAGSLMPVKADLVIGMDFGSEPAVVYGYGPMMYALPKATWRLLNEGSGFAANSLIDDLLHP